MITEEIKDAIREVYQSAARVQVLLEMEKYDEATEAAVQVTLHGEELERSLNRLIDHLDDISTPDLGSPHERRKQGPH